MAFRSPFQKVPTPHPRRCDRKLVWLAPALVLLHGAAQAEGNLAATAPGAEGTAPGAGTSLPTIVVQARHDAPGSGSLDSIADEPLALTPLAVDLIDRADLDDRDVTSLSSAIRVDPAVGDNYNTFGYIEALQVRGFTLNELLNYERDGMTVSSHVPVALEDKERIEVLKGVSGMLAGSSAPGGLLNYVLKQPTETPLAELDANVGERGSARLHGDFGGRFGAGQAFGYRINLAAEERRPEIDNAWAKRGLASGFFDWRVAPGTLLQFEIEHQQVREISVPGYGLLDTSGTGVATTLPAPIDPRINLNAQPWTQPFESTATSGSLRLEQRLGADWTLRLKAGTQRSVANDRIAFPDGCSSGPAYVYNGLCGNDNVDLYQYISDDERRNANDTEARLHGRLQAGALAQELTLGTRTTRYSERYPYEQTYTYAGTINVYAPVALPAQPGPNTLNAPLDTDLDELFAFDVLRFGSRMSAWLGARYTRITQDSSLTDGSQATTLQQHLITPWAGVGVEPWPGGFAYASVGSGVEVANSPNHPTVTVRATGAALTLDNPGQALPAQRSRQAELGFKQHADPSLGLEAALFRIEKPFVDILPTGPSDAIEAAGARVERHQGLELSADWRARTNLEWKLAASLMDARTIAAADPSWVGKAATNVAPYALALQDNWAPQALPGLRWMNLWTLAGHKTVLPDGSVDLPAAWQWDTNLRYDWEQAGGHWTWRAGVDNVTDRRYWREAPMASWGSIYLFPAAARSAHLGLAVSW
jgi:iron complex outermembrane receptor protein